MKQPNSNITMLLLLLFFVELQFVLSSFLFIFRNMKNR